MTVCTFGPLAFGVEWCENHFYRTQIQRMIMEYMLMVVADNHVSRNIILIPIQAENVKLQQSNEEKELDIRRLEENLEHLRKAESSLRKEKHKVKEHEKTIEKLEEDLATTKEELDTLQVSSSLTLFSVHLFNFANSLLIAVR